MVDQVREISIALGDYSVARLLKENEVTCPRVKLNFADYPVINRAFAPMVRTLAFDVSELALVTFLQALDAGKPLRLLPVVVVGRLHHGSILYNPEKGPLTPADLKGRRVGMRAYSQTTGMWVRSILQHQYGVPMDEVTWVGTEGANVAEYKGPPNVEIREGAKEMDMLSAGEVCAVLGGAKKAKDRGFKLLIPDAEAAAAEWYAKHKTVMINHMVAVTEEFMRKDPSAVRDVYHMLCQATDMTASEREGGKLSAVGYGPDRIWDGGAIQLAMQYSIEQKLISRTFDRKEIFAEVAG